MSTEKKSAGPSRQKDILKHLFVYLGSAWVVIEALNFLIYKYYWNSKLLDVLIILIIFGLPAVVIYVWHDRKFTRNAIILHAVNAAVMFTVITFSLAKPGIVDTNQIRIFRFQENQRKLAESIRALAVLPFSNYTGEEENEMTVLGMHDALINELGRISAIRVISKTSTLPYLQTSKSVKQIASELKVDALIESSVMKVDEGIRIVVKMINADPEQQLWTRTFDSDRENFLGLYSQIVSEIAGQINVALSPDEQTYIEEEKMVDPEAYKAYLEGIYHMETLTERGFHLALENFERSIAIDSLFAPNYAGLAFAWMAAVQMRYVTVAEGIPEIYNNYLNVLALEPDDPQARYIEALMSLQGEWNWEKSETAFRKSIAGNPNYALSHAYYSHLLMFQRRFDEAFDELEQAVAIDPNNGLVYVLYSVVLWHHGDLDRAMQFSEKALELNPMGTLNNRVGEAVNYLKGNYEESLEMLRVVHGSEVSDFQKIIEIFERSGYQAAMQELAVLLQESSYLYSLMIAMYYNRAGMEEEAIQWLERGLAMHDPDMPYAFLPIELRNLVSNPRYVALAEKMNLPLPEPLE